MTKQSIESGAQTGGDALAKFVASLALESSAPHQASITPVDGPKNGLPPSVPVAFNRTTQKFESIKALIEEYRVRPERRAGTAKVLTLASLIDLTNRHGDRDISALFGQTKWPEPSITAVIDYHHADRTPDNCRHRVRYDFPLTDEFKVWITNNRKVMEQAEFARFLEDHAAELSSPMDGERSEYERLFKERFATPAELITLSRNLEVFVGHHVKRVERPKSGERTIVFEETQTNAAGEAVDIPGVFMLSVQAFMDGAAVRIPARLRFRPAGGGVTWFYDLYRWEHWLREQVVNDLGRAAKETGLPAYEGAPELG